MTCPNCRSAMTHEGYFAWRCGACGHRVEGELPRAATVVPAARAANG